MTIDHVTFSARPKLVNGTMLLALTGWMDGGLVSTGTVKRMMENRQAVEVARIDGDPFYIFNMPGSMEVAAMFRPEVRHVAGVIETPPDMPENVFHVDADAGLVFFLGKEPNLKWQAFADGIFGVAREVGVTRIIFMGSFGGTVPHTRQPRMYGSVSHDRLKGLLDEYGVKPSDYEGPASFSSLLTAQAPRHNMEMIALVAEIPGYLQGINPLSIEAVTRRLAKILNVPVDVDAMRKASNAWEARVSEAVEKDGELAETVRKLEDRYDNELIGASAAEEGDVVEEDDEEE